MRRAGRIGALAGMLLALVLAAPATAAPARFFFAGDGHLILRHAYFDTTLDAHYRHRDGTYDEATLHRIEHFFRSREDGKEAPVSLRLIELLSYVQEHYHPRQMILLSGYRSPEFNLDLHNAGRATALASLHTEAMAADIMFVGLDMNRLWHQLRDLGTGGAGYYRANKFLHVDTGPPRFWEASTSRVSENLSADNARIFLRTDFDRYARLDGAVLGLHSVTAFPIYIAGTAETIGPAGTQTVTVQPLSGASARPDGCFAVEPPADSHAFRVTGVTAPTSMPPAGDVRGKSGAGGSSSAHIRLSTCEPRIGKTPAQIESNRIELSLD